jgi:hypothetical protein
MKFVTTLQVWLKERRASMEKTVGQEDMTWPEQYQKIIAQRCFAGLQEYASSLKADTNRANMDIEDV